MVNINRKRKESTMGKKDITEKKLEDYPDVFADIVNTLLFNGETVIKESNITAGPTASIYKAETGDSKEQFRDTLKYIRGADILISSIGIENQSDVISHMPIRVMGYDYSSYRQQLIEKNPVRPVITMVLNFSEGKWNKAKSLYDMFGEVAEEIKPYLQDYKLNIFDIRFIDDETIKKFKSDFKEVVCVFKYGQSYAQHFKTEETEMSHSDEVIELMSFLNKKSSFDLAGFKTLKKQKGGRVVMSDVINEIMDRGREEGKVETIYMLIDSGEITLERGAQILGISVEQLKKDRGL